LSLEYQKFYYELTQSVYFFHQEGYVFVGVSLLVSYFVCLLTGLRKNYSTDFHKIRWKSGT